MNRRVRAWREQNEIYRLDFGPTTDRVKIRTVNMLARNNITTVKTLAEAYADGRLLDLRGLGEKGFLAVEQALRRRPGPARRWLKRLWTRATRAIAGRSRTLGG